LNEAVEYLNGNGDLPAVGSVVVRESVVTALVADADAGTYESKGIGADNECCHLELRDCRIIYGVPEERCG